MATFADIKLKVDNLNEQHKQLIEEQLMSYKDIGYTHIIDVNGCKIPLTEENALAYENLIEYDDKNNPLPAANMTHQEVDAFLDGFCKQLYANFELDGCLLDIDGYQPIMTYNSDEADFIRSEFNHWYEDGHFGVDTIDRLLSTPSYEFV